MSRSVVVVRRAMLMCDARGCDRCVCQEGGLAPLLSLARTSGWEIPVRRDGKHLCPKHKAERIKRNQ